MEIARVLVVHAPRSVAKDFIDYPYFSDLGAVQLAAVLRADVEVDLVDAFALPGAGLRWQADGRAQLGAELSELFAAVTRCARPDAIVVSYDAFCRPPHRDALVHEVLAWLRAWAGDAAVLLLADTYQSGQHYVEAESSKVLCAYPQVDAWVKYEAEVTVPALLAASERPRGCIVGERPSDLNALPLPAWDLVDLEAHDAFCASIVAKLGRAQWPFAITPRTLPVLTSRGCPFRCIHCSSNPDLKPGEPKQQRRLGPERMQAYFGELKQHHGVARIAVLDELINVGRTHFDEFLNAVEHHDLLFDVPNGMRADHLREHHFPRMLGRAQTLSVSAESGSQRVVTEVVGKRLDLDAIERTAKHAHACGLPVMVHYIIGLPSETKAEINETLALALRLWDDYRAWPAVQFATPLPGTQLAEGHKLPIVDDWGPRFQTEPTTTASSQVSATELLEFRRTFDERIAASTGPQKLIVNVTYVCNNHCTFCAVGTRTQVDAHPTRLREHLDKHRKRGVEMVDFDGGEPTLNPKLIGLIRYARAVGYQKINVTTNGRMCVYPDYARKLTHSGLTTLLFSVHGADARTHTQHVGVPEAFEQTVQGIRNCVELRPAQLELGMNITVTKGNVHQLPLVAELCAELDLAWLNIQFLTPFGRATEGLAPDMDVATELTRALIDNWSERMRIRVINLPYCLLPGYESFLEGDRLKLARHMVFVNNETVNLAEYLAQNRVHEPQCADCPHACFCGGFYRLERTPEPPWLVAPEDLVRPIQS